jgi:hypothetical protein
MLVTRSAQFEFAISVTSSNIVVIECEAKGANPNPRDYGLRSPVPVRFVVGANRKQASHMGENEIPPKRGLPPHDE